MNFAALVTGAPLLTVILIVAAFVVAHLWNSQEKANLRSSRDFWKERAEAAERASTRGEGSGSP